MLRSSLRTLSHALHQHSFYRRVQLHRTSIIQHTHADQLNGQKRNVFLAAKETPNPQSMKFVTVNHQILEPGITKDYNSPLIAYSSPLAKAVFKIDGVRRVFITENYVTVTIAEETDWQLAKLQIFTALQQFFDSGRPVLDEEAQPSPDTKIQEEDDEVVIAIKEILETKIRPMVQEDGGDVLLDRFEDGIVWLKMQGSCSGCPSSSVTLKHGIENMLMHYVPEVEEVRQVEDDSLSVSSNEQFQKLEDDLKQKQNA
jgi:Fe-S cluster biogenesis protein NfuA